MIFVNLDELKKLWSQHSFPLAPDDQQIFFNQLRSMGIDPEGFYQEVEMTSPYVNTHRDASFSNSVIRLHSHSFYEVLCCLNTCGVEYLVGTERYRLQKGDIVFVSPGVSHRPLLPENLPEPYERDVLWFSRKFVDLCGQLAPLPANAVQRRTSLVRTAGTEWEFLPDMFRRGVQEHENPQSGSEIAIIGNSMLLLTQLTRAFQDVHTAPVKAEKPELLDEVMGYIEEHLAEKISLPETAKHFYVSESTISHVFQKKMGVSFYRCVTQRRLIAAKSLIWEGESLENVSHAVGFSDYSTFYRAFKQEYGISPRQFEQMEHLSEE